MGIHKGETLIEKISDGSELSDAMLVAMKKCNKKIQEWIEGLPEKINCLLCGLHVEKSELLFYTEDVPQFLFDEKSGSVKANRIVFGLCSNCAEQLDKEDNELEGWDSRPLLKWQEELLNSGTWDMSTFHSRGEAKRFIVNWLKN